MSLSMTTPSHDIRTCLAHALGYRNYPTDVTPEPYLTYICKKHVSSMALEKWLELFIEVIRHFDANANGSGRGKSIQALINKLVDSRFERFFPGPYDDELAKVEHVEDTVMYILGTWATMLSSFRQRYQSRKVVVAYRCSSNKTSAPQPYENNVAGLVASSELLPGGRWDQKDEFSQGAAAKLMMLLSSSQNIPASLMHTSLQSIYCQAFGAQASHTPFQLFEDVDAHDSLSIRVMRLNACTLNVLSAVRVSWTQNVSRHMMLTELSGRYTLELFSLPCAFTETTCECVGIPRELTAEIKSSYAMLFNAWHETPLHVKLGKFYIRCVCWCWSCSSYRYRRKCIKDCKQDASTCTRQKAIGRDIVESHFDPLLVKLSEGDPEGDWTQDIFPNLWARISRLEQHLQTSRPWSLGVLFLDRRDTMQFWTFLFATIVVILTIAQVLLGVAQVVGSFK